MTRRRFSTTRAGRSTWLGRSALLSTGVALAVAWPSGVDGQQIYLTGGQVIDPITREVRTENLYLEYGIVGGGFPGLNANLDLLLDRGLVIAVMSNYGQAASPIASGINNLIARSDGTSR